MYLTHEPIHLAQFLTPPGDFSAGGGPAGSVAGTAGADVLFLGIVRNHSEEREVLFLEYEAYEEMAEALLHELVQEVSVKWPLERIQLLHRLGRIPPGEIAVATDVRSAHRKEAYQASRYLIEEIKRKIPIWKKEYFADGTSEWSLGCRHADLQTSA